MTLLGSLPLWPHPAGRAAGKRSAQLEGSLISCNKERRDFNGRLDILIQGSNPHLSHPLPLPLPPPETTIQKALESLIRSCRPSQDPQSQESDLGVSFQREHPSSHLPYEGVREASVSTACQAPHSVSSCSPSPVPRH